MPRLRWLHMFVSHLEHEFPIPPALNDPGTQHWRMVELSLHTPWFLLSVEFVHPDELDLRTTRTLCIAWEYDLADVLRPLDADRVKGIVCMMPGWQSPTGQWWSREVREVWLHSSPAGKHVVLADTNGELFDCGLIPEHVGDVDKELLLRIEPESAGGPLGGRTAQPATGRKGRTRPRR